MSKQVLHIHIPRTGGQSMKRWPKKHGIDMQSLYVFRKGGGGHRGTYRTLEEWRNWFDPTKQWTYLGHTLACDFLDEKIISQEWYNACFKFAFVRNTWAHIVSCFELLRRIRRIRDNPTILSRHLLHFSDFVRFLVSKHEETPFLRYNLQQQVYLAEGVDFIGRFEKMQEDWETLCGLVGVPYYPLDKRNSTRPWMQFRTDYREYYTDNLAETVAKFYAGEIQRFGFTFDGGVVRSNRRLVRRKQA